MAQNLFNEYSVTFQGAHYSYKCLYLGAGTGLIKKFDLYVKQLDEMIYTVFQCTLTVSVH